MRIAFHTTQLSIRGTEVALFDYARFHQELLGGESIIVYDQTSPANDAAVREKFARHFQLYPYRQFAEVDPILDRCRAELLYSIKGDGRDRLLSQAVPTMVHGVFPQPPSQFHGAAFAFVSDWLSQACSNGRVPVVPHIVTTPAANGDLRQQLAIPDDAMVFGCMGGTDSFNIAFVHKAVSQAVQRSERLHFVFLNIPSFCEHPRVHFLPGCADPLYKAQFIDTCDAMLHARWRGETFGLACAEFSIRNKPVLTYGGSRERSHIEMLGAKALIYDGPRSLMRLLLGLNPRELRQSDWDAYSKLFSPAAVMQQFQSGLIDTAVRRGITEDAGIVMDWRDRARCRLYKSAVKLHRIRRLWPG